MVSSLETETIQIQPPSPQNQTAAPHSQKRSTTQLNSPSRFAVAIGRFFPHPSVSAFTFIYIYIPVCEACRAVSPNARKQQHRALYVHNSFKPIDTLISFGLAQRDRIARACLAISPTRSNRSVDWSCSSYTHTYRLKKTVQKVVK